MIVEKPVNIIVLYPVNSNKEETDDLTDDERTDYALFLHEAIKHNKSFDIQKKIVDGKIRDVLYVEDTKTTLQELRKIAVKCKEKGYLYPIVRLSVDTSFKQTEPYVDSYAENELKEESVELTLSKASKIIAVVMIGAIAFIVTLLLHSLLQIL